MRVLQLIFFVAALAGSSLWLGTGAQPHAQGNPNQPVHRFVKITDDIYSAVSTGAMNIGSNSTIIINDHDVLIVDSHATPASARALATDLKQLTDKPIRYVVNTHYHFDHAHGNQIFPPEVEVIGHEFTREMLRQDVLSQRTNQFFNAGVGKEVEALERQAAAAPAQSEERRRLERRVAVQQAYAKALTEVRPTPPTLTFQRQLTLYRGNREIRLLFLGRGHTAGDVVVFLPKERVLCTGDLITGDGLSYMGDAHVDEWRTTLDAVKALDFDLVSPGHGAVFTGKERFDRFQAYLEDLWLQTSALRARGVSAEAAATQVDLRAHRQAFPEITTAGADPLAIMRIYDVLGGQQLPR